VVYDAIIHCCLALLTCLTARRLSDALPWWVAFVAGLAILPLGTAGRPDEVGPCFPFGAPLSPLPAPLPPPHLVVFGNLFRVVCRHPPAGRRRFCPDRTPLFGCRWRFTAAPRFAGTCVGRLGVAYLGRLLSTGPYRRARCVSAVPGPRAAHLRTRALRSVTL